MQCYMLTRMQALCQCFLSYLVKNATLMVMSLKVACFDHGSVSQ